MKKMNILAILLLQLCLVPIAHGGVTITPTDKTGVGALVGIIDSIGVDLLAIGGALAVLMIIIAGIRYMTSAGNETGIKAAKATLTYAIVGLLVVAFSSFIVLLVQSFF